MTTDTHYSALQLVFDTNVLVDALAARDLNGQYAAAVLDTVRQGEVEGWYAPHTLMAVYAQLETLLAAPKAYALVQELATVIKPLPQVGDELVQLDLPAGGRLDQMLSIHLAEDYLPNPLFVTDDPEFPQTAERRVVHSKLLAEQGVAPWQNPESRLPFIALALQQRAIRPQLQRNIHRVLQHGQYILGPEVSELEQRLADYTGAEHCVTAASGTEALLISLMALSVGPGDEVITTPFSFIATTEVIVLLGARPVFADVEPDTANIDASAIEAQISSCTRAIMPVSLYGQPADMEAINAVAARYNLPVIEDAAQSFGAEYQGRKSTNLSTVGCTSFFPSKPLGGYGDGGAIFTNHANLAQVCRELRVHGQSERYLHTRIGVGGRMDSLQCAVVLAKLERFEQEVQRRQAIGARYNTLLDQAGIARVQQRPDRSSVFAQYTLFTEQRERGQAALQRAGIPTAVHYPLPLNLQPAYQRLCCPDCTPVAASLAQRVLSLPMGADLRPDQQQRIVEALTAAVNQ